MLEDKVLGVLQHLDHGVQAPSDATDPGVCDNPRFVTIKPGAKHGDC